MTPFRLNVLVGDVVPKGYGLAYYKINQDVGVFYPIPLNVFVRFYRDLWHWLARGCYKSWWDREQARLINLGRELERNSNGRITTVTAEHGGQPKMIPSSTNPICPHCHQPMLLYRNSDSDRMFHRTFFCACRTPLTWNNELTRKTGTMEALDNEPARF